MNYYDYRSYFQAIEGSLDSIYNRQAELLTEVREMRTETKEGFETLNTTISQGVTLISALIVISSALKVIFG